MHILEGIGFDSNQYLIEGDKRLLIDTGSGLHLKNTIDFIETHVKTIDTIILTHRHIDHTGGAKSLAKRYDCRVYSSKDDSIPLIEGKQDSILQLGLEIPKLDVKTFEYGERLDEYGLEIMHSPGHTVGSVVLYNENELSIFSGDTIFAFGGVGRWDLDTGNLTQLLESIKKLAELEIRNLYPGHGPWINENGNEHVIMALTALEEMV